MKQNNDADLDLFEVITWLWVTSEVYYAATWATFWAQSRQNKKNPP